MALNRSITFGPAITPGFLLSAHHTETLSMPDFLRPWQRWLLHLIFTRSNVGAIVVGNPAQDTWTIWARPRVGDASSADPEALDDGNPELITNYLEELYRAPAADRRH